MKKTEPKKSKASAKKAERELKKKNAANAENLFPTGVMVTVDGKSNSILTHLPSLLPSGWWVCGVHNIGAVRCERVELVKEVGA